jgi:hypothetical protein
MIKTVFQNFENPNLKKSKKGKKERVLSPHPFFDFATFNR